MSRTSILPAFKKSAPFTVVCDNTVVFVKTSIDSTPRSVVRGHILLCPTKKLASAKISVSLIQKTQVKLLNAMQAVNEQVSERKLASQSLVLPDARKGKKINANPKVYLEPGKYKYSFGLWVPDNLEPTIKSELFSVEYFIRTKLRYRSENKWFGYNKDATTITPLTLHTLPGFLKSEQLENTLSLPTYNCLYENQGVEVILQLPSKYFTNSFSRGRNATLLIGSSSTSQDSQVHCKSLTLELFEEILFCSFVKADFKAVTSLFKEKYTFRRSNKDTLLAQGGSLPGINKGAFKCIKEYANIILPFVAKECHSSLSLNKLTVSHHLKVTAILESKDAKHSKTIQVKLELFFLTSSAQDSICSLPLYRDFPSDSLAYPNSCSVLYS